VADIFSLGLCFLFPSMLVANKKLMLGVIKGSPLEHIEEENQWGLANPDLV